MNVIREQTNHKLLAYQTLRLKDLIKEIIDCSEGRKLYETQKFDLPYAELNCLLLFIGERYLTVKGIAQSLEVAKSRVTKLINGLISKGLVESVDDPNDARVKLIRLTSAGERKAAIIEDFHREIHQKILEQFSVKERKNIISNLEILRSAMEAVKEQLI